MIKVIKDTYRDIIFHVCDHCKTEKEYFGLYDPNGITPKQWSSKIDQSIDGTFLRLYCPTCSKQIL